MVRGYEPMTERNTRQVSNWASALSVTYVVDVNVCRLWPAEGKEYICYL